MTSINSVTTDTRVVPAVRGASGASTTRRESDSDSDSQDAGFAGWRGEIATSRLGGSGWPVNPEPGAAGDTPRAGGGPAVPPAPPAPPVHAPSRPGPPPAADRLSAPVLTATAAIGSLQARQRTYHALARTLDFSSATIPSGDEAPESLIFNMRFTLVTQRSMEAAQVGDTVAGANRLALAVASAQASVHEVRPGFPDSSAGVNRRDALVQAWVRLTGGSVVASGDGGLQLSLGGAAVLDQAGRHDLSVTRQTDGTGHLGILVSRTDGTTEPVAVASGVLGGLLETVNEVIPRVLAALAGADALRGGTSQDPDAFRRLLGLSRGGRGADQVSAEYLHTQGEGRDPVRDSVLVEQHLGVTSADSARAGAAAVAQLQRVNAAVLSMGSAAKAVMSVLSAARPAAAASQLTFGIDEVLNEGRPFSFGVEQRLAGQTRATTVTVGEFPTVRDVAAAINNSAAGVRASTSQIATGTVQLRVTSLITGHTAQVTITDGQQPPATSTILGRFRAMEGADTLDARDAAGRARALESLVQAAGSVLETVSRATSAGAAAAGDRMLAGLAGRVAGELMGPAGRALPGLTFGRHALSLDRDHVARALQSDPVGTEAAAVALAGGLVEISREVFAPGQGYLAVRLAVDQGATSDIRAPHPGTDDVLSRHQDTLEQRSRALASLLDRLGAQGSWLSTALPAAW